MRICCPLGSITALFFNIHGRIHTVLIGVVLAGVVVLRVSYPTHLWDRNRWIRSVNASSDGAFWLWIVAIVLFLGVLPLVCLWAYHAIQHPVQ